MAGDVYRGDEGIPFGPALDVEDRVVDGLRRRVDSGGAVDGEGAAVGDLGGCAWADVGRVVEGFALQGHCEVLSRGEVCGRV